MLAPTLLMVLAALTGVVGFGGFAGEIAGPARFAFLPLFALAVWVIVLRATRVGAHEDESLSG